MARAGDSEDEVMMRLSRVLETQSFAVSDDGSTTADLLNKISKEIDDVPQNDDDTFAPTSSVYSGQSVGGGGLGRGQTRLPRRPTPYEVWENTYAAPDRLERTRPPEPQQRPKLDDEEWNMLVDHLHRSNRMKEIAILQKQNEALRHEMNGATFQPHLNANSRRKTAHNRPLTERTEILEKKKKKFLEKQKQEQEEEEMKQCTFEPRIESKARSEQMLAARHGGQTPRRNVNELFKFSEEKRIRAQHRKQILQELEDRELSFAPQLNRTSLQIQEKLMREGRIVVDHNTGQTVALPRENSVREASKAAVDPGHEEETFQPSISERASTYEFVDESRVFDRLYEHAQEVRDAKKLSQSDMEHAYDAGLLKPWERTDGMTGTLAGTKAYRNIRAEHHEALRKDMVEHSSQPVTIVPYSPQVRHIWEKLHECQPLDPDHQFGATTATDADAQAAAAAGIATGAWEEQEQMPVHMPGTTPGHEYQHSTPQHHQQQRQQQQQQQQQQQGRQVW